MTLEFSLNSVAITEFGVGNDGDGNPEFSVVPVNADVKSALQSMAQATLQSMEAGEDEPAEYDPAEKHASTEYLYLPAGGPLDAAVRDLHDAENLPIDGAGLANPETVFCYFARFRDEQNRRLTAIRRASHFKGVLKRKLLHFVDDTLKVIEDKVFRLDVDFDLLLDSDFTHIWRPSSFEFLGGLQQRILDAVPGNVDAIAADLPFADLSGIEDYASSRPRAARYLASIRSQGLAGTDQDALLALCGNTGVGVEDVNGEFKVAPGHEMGFLEVLDRRRYRLELIPGQSERFRASSRVRIGG